MLSIVAICGTENIATNPPVITAETTLQLLIMVEHPGGADLTTAAVIAFVRMSANPMPDSSFVMYNIIELF